MTEHLTLDLVDREAAVRGDTRRDVFKKLAAGGTVITGGLMLGGLPAVAQGQSAGQDGEILNFALLLEYLESEFYVRAVEGGALTGALLEFATVVRDHELAHVAALQDALGSAAIAKPTFDFRNTTTDPALFSATALALEDTGVAAYNGQGSNLRRRTLPAAASIVSVEARHAAWIRRLVAGPGYSDGRSSYPAPDVVDPLFSRRRVEQIVGETGFITG
jgi:Ferritin-like domain